MPDINDGNNLNTIVKATEIIEAIRELDGATLTELASYLDMATSTIHDYLLTLENIHYITKEDGEYRLSLTFFTYGMHAKQSVGIVDIAKPILEKVADETGEKVWLVVEAFGKSVLLEEATGENAVPMEADVGNRVDIHSVAGGKAILAYRDESHIRNVIDRHGLPARTEYTITDEEEFLDELETVRENGYAVNRQESVLGLRSISAPIRKDGDVIAAISVAGPAHRLTDSRIDGQLSTLLLESSNEIELKTKYS